MPIRPRFYLTASILMSLAMLAACSVPKGVRLERMKDEYEALGRLSARASQCGLPVPSYGQLLNDHATKEGADAQETQSLVSYHDAALAEAGRTNTPCADSEKQGVQREFESRLKGLQ